MKQSRYYIFNNGCVLLHQDRIVTEHPTWIDREALRVYDETDDALCYMGEDDREVLPEGYAWVELRESFYRLPSMTYREAGKASELLHFDCQHRYCGVCGAPMEWGSIISKRCTQCGKEIWPKLNTAIIVLVRRGEQALLVKAKNFRRDFYGLVAGFIETGESLEECVAREVYEETGLRVANIRYFGSQPWPYPMGLMVGFRADYAGGELVLRDGELRDAKFFSRNNIPTIPDKMSMARILIDDWVSNKE